MDFWDEINETIEFSEDLQSQTKKDERFRNCMKYVVISEQKDGSRKVNYWRCKDPRCDYCNNYKGSEYKARILELIKTKRVYYIELPHEIASKLCKKLKKDNYLRFPIDDLVDSVFFVYPSSLSDADLVDEQFVNEHDWAYTAKKKTTRNISGNLGKPQVTEDDGMEVDAADIVASPKDLVEKSVVDTCAKIYAWVQPETVYAYVNARKYFNDELIKSLESNGCTIMFKTFKKLKVQNLSLNFFSPVSDES
jgi:hypothetical protein